MAYHYLDGVRNEVEYEDAKAKARITIEKIVRAMLDELSIGHPTTQYNEDPNYLRKKSRKRVILTTLDSKLLKFYKYPHPNGLSDLKDSVLDTEGFFSSVQMLDRKSSLPWDEIDEICSDGEILNDIRLRALLLLMLLSINSEYLTNSFTTTLDKLSKSHEVSTVEFVALIKELVKRIDEHKEELQNGPRFRENLKLIFFLENMRDSIISTLKSIAYLGVDVEFTES